MKEKMKMKKKRMNMMVSIIQKIKISLILATNPNNKINKMLYGNRANQSILKTELELKNFCRCKASNSLNKFNKCQTLNSSNLPSLID